MTGWECPKCGRCYSPYTAQCLACPVTPTAFGGTTTIVLTGATLQCKCGTSAFGVCPIHGGNIVYGTPPSLS